jgi:ParB/RepB/Spo0J family partition protein
MSETAEYRHELELKHIHPNPLNPRKHFEPEKMKELTESVREKGVLQPILVRPLKVAGSAKASADFEIVFGHRRFEAAKKAGLDSIPAVVRELDDKEVIEAALLENAQRSDVHPLEQAEALRQLHETHGIGTDELAVKMGKSKRWVETQLQLCKLVKEARSAFLDNKFSASIALLLARIPDEQLQLAVMKRVATPGYDGEPMSYRRALDLIYREYMLPLSEAPFDPKDAELVPGCGACSKCPKRTGTQPDLFHDINQKEICTDPPCYQKKVDAHRDQVLAEAKAKGAAVIEGDEAKKVFKDRYTDPAGYVELKKDIWTGKDYKPLNRLVDKKTLAAEKVTAVNPHTNAIVELVPQKIANRLLKEAGVQQRPNRSSGDGAWEKNQKRERAKQEFRESVLKAAIGKAVAEVEKAKPDVAFWRTLAEALSDGGDSDLLEERRGFKAGELQKKAASMGEAELRGVVFELAIGVWSSTYNSYDKRMKATLKQFGVNLEKLDEQAQKEAKAAEKEKKKTAKAPKKKVAEAAA